MEPEHPSGDLQQDETYDDHDHSPSSSVIAPIQVETVRWGVEPDMWIQSLPALVGTMTERTFDREGSRCIITLRDHRQNVLADPTQRHDVISVVVCRYTRRHTFDTIASDGYTLAVRGPRGCKLCVADGA